MMLRAILQSRCKEAIDEIGGPRHLARSLQHYGQNITFQGVHKWRKVPERYLDLVAALAEKPREYLRPDLRKLAPVSKLPSNYIQSLARGAFAALQAEKIVRARFGLPKIFARQECKKRRIAIYVASMAIEDVQVLSIAAHFAISHTAVNKAKAEIETEREDSLWLDRVLDELCAEVVESWAQYGF